MAINEGRQIWNAGVSISDAAKPMHSIATITEPYDVAALDITLFVYCHDDAAFIATTLEMLADALAALELTYEIIVIDDASRDGSPEKIREFIIARPELNVLLAINPQKKSLSHCYVDAAFMGKGRYFRLVYGDSAETMETLIDILKAVGEADILIPYIVSGLHSDATSQGFSNFYARSINLVSGHKIRDYSLPAVHLRYNVARWQSGVRGYGFQVDLLCKLLDMGFTYTQMPCRSVLERPVSHAHASIFRNIYGLLYTLWAMLARRIASRLKL